MIAICVFLRYSDQVRDYVHITASIEKQYIVRRDHVLPPCDSSTIHLDKTVGIKFQTRPVSIKVSHIYE